ncbi:MAG TPA: GGDEF domain-containing protein [Terracidiphilus sp.]|nr:GGDEF domain-containing protein [Terracidiphilus sp.]
MDWSTFPDLVAIALLVCAFASVERQGQSKVSTLWLTGWVLIALHFASDIYAALPGLRGDVASFLAISSLTCAGVLFSFACVPYRHERSARWMLVALLIAHNAYLLTLSFAPQSSRLLDASAALYAVLPLGITLVSIRRFRHNLRWMMLSLYCALSIFLVAVQHRPNGTDLAVNGVLFAVYIGCCLHFCYSYRRATTGAFISIAGFFAWAMVFVVGPFSQAWYPSIQVESEVWNLPKYVVAVGMLLLLLEDQIEHNKYLALHDELTGLPNRRLFLDRLQVALERARRAGQKVALLVVDLDRFKQVNDTLGHHAGDSLLQQVGAIFTGRVRHSDTVARTGGDEFSLILEDTFSSQNAESVAHSLMQRLDEPLKVENRLFRVGASIGIAVFPDDGNDLEALCIAADLRMYKEKRSTQPQDRSSRPNEQVYASFEGLSKVGAHDSGDFPA